MTQAASNSRPNSRPTVLIIKLSSLGDLFHALPAVHCIKEGLAADIHWVVQSEYQSLVECFDDVDKVIPFQRRAAWKNAAGLRRALTETRYDYAIDLQGLMKSALVARLAGARHCIGPSYHREGSRLFYHKVPGPVNRERHAVDQAMDVLSVLGVSAGVMSFPVTFPAVTISGGGPRIALAPQSRWLTKNWPAERFVEVANIVQTRHGGTVFLFGGPGDRELTSWMEERITGSVQNLAGRVNLVETGGYLKEMDLLLANDTGPVHMAAALGIPTVVVFGATDPRRTGPYGPSHLIAQSDLDCRPCLSRVCRRADRKCLTDVTVSHVVDLVNRVLATKKR